MDAGVPEGEVVARGAKAPWSAPEASNTGTVGDDAPLGRNAPGVAPGDTHPPRTNLAWFARRQGATGPTGEHEAERAAALTIPRPVAVYARAHRAAPSLIFAVRIESLSCQGAPR